MNTKVKGDKIKEGSIPLSALSNEVKDKIENAGGGADWNAQQGEAGYIENKPFDSIIQNLDFELYDEKAYAYILNIGNYDGFYISGKPVQFNDNYNFTIEYFAGFDSYSGITIELQGSDIYITPNYLDTYVGDTIEMFVDDCKRKIKLFKIIKVIDPLFIPNTVIKTIPQTLSDTDKNQALANLGIADLLEALKPVELVRDSEFPTGDNVSQEDLDSIGLTRTVIDNILNGITTKVNYNGTLSDVTGVYKWNTGFKFSLIFIEDPQIIDTETGIISTFFSASSYNVKYNGTNYKCSTSDF